MWGINTLWYPETYLWDDGCINAGVEWQKEIFDNLENADIVLCLISSSFIASDFCYKEELEMALIAHNKGDKVIIPVRIRECNWELLPIGRLQSLPKNRWVTSINDDAS